MSTKYKILCGVAPAYCTGGHLITDQHFQTTKCHSTREEAFNCMARHLVRDMGFERIGQREFRDPKGGIRVLTKKIRYGGRLRTGKENRYMPDGREVGGNAGLIVG